MPDKASDPGFPDGYESCAIGIPHQCLVAPRCEAVRAIFDTHAPCAGVRLRPPTIAVATRLPWTEVVWDGPDRWPFEVGPKTSIWPHQQETPSSNGFFQKPTDFHTDHVLSPTGGSQVGVQWLGSGPGGVWEFAGFVGLDRAGWGPMADSTAVAPLPSRRTAHNSSGQSMAPAITTVGHEPRGLGEVDGRQNLALL